MTGSSAPALDPHVCDSVRAALHMPLISDDDTSIVMPTEWASDVRALAADLDGEIASTLIEVADLQERWLRELESFDGESSARMETLEEEAMRWAVEACVPVEPVYGCKLSGGVEHDPPVLEPSRPATPEEAAAAEGTDGLERVEVSRFDDGVAFAWVDANQVARHAVEVVEVDGAWAVAAIRTC